MDLPSLPSSPSCPPPPSMTSVNAPISGEECPPCNPGQRLRRSTLRSSLTSPGSGTSQSSSRRKLKTRRKPGSTRCCSIFSKYVCPSRNLNLNVTLLSSTKGSLLLLILPLFTWLSLSLSVFPGVEGQFSPLGGAMFDGMCPVPECYCGLDSRGRMEVNCPAGGMDEIPTSRMSPAIEIIRIQGPGNRPNHLTIGRFFRNFRKLEELHITGSSVPNIGENNFMGVTSLKLLNLSRNNLNLIVDSNFKGLTNLETLSVSENRIDSFVSASFEHLPKLKVLDLSKNKITKLVERLFYNLHMLEVLDLSDNRLKELNADVFRDIWRLKEFRCQRCQLKSIPTLWYSLLPALRKLDLRNNDFKYLHEAEFSNLKSIEEIYLDGNRIAVLAEESFRFTRLRHLSLASNGLISVDRSAFVNASVATIDLSGNKFESLNKLIFLDLKHNLTKLDLSRNPKLKISSLLIILSENTKLKWLSVSRNNYEDLPLDLFEDNRALQYLNLSHNRLRELFPRQFSQLGNLQILDLSFNRLRGIEQEVLNVFDRISTIREIRLEGNPWSCDLCHIPPMHKWVQTSPIFRKGCTLPTGPFCLRCRGPSDFYDKPLIHIDETALEWCDPYADEFGDSSRLSMFLGFGIILFILILITTGVILRFYFQSAHYYTHEENRPDLGGCVDSPVDYNDIDAVGEGGQYYATINGTHTKMIATIDEKNFDPDANFYPDLTTTLNPLHPHYGGRSPTTMAASPSISHKNEYHHPHLHQQQHHSNNR